MTPKEKGRFCSSCAKTVIDFTKKSTKEIKEYLVENKNQRVCGHFYKKQLDSIVIEIPKTTFSQQLTFQKLFILALFFVMGTTLFSCKYADGQKQKIENIIISDTTKIVREIDSVTKKRIDCKTPNKKDTIIELMTVGEVAENHVIDGEVTIDGDIEYEEVEEVTFGFVLIEEPPRFKEAKKLPTSEVRDDFNERMKKFVQENFDLKITKNLDLKKGTYKIFTRFVIDKKRNVTDIKIRAPHPKLKKEVKKMLEKLPQFIPGKQQNQVIKTSYIFPISFEVE
ncbi:energy transducer TonB [Polaribacter sp. BM10]|uniref:energy transducer TonB n=1 Tax=Polaribacter sp. BM10 TaxID=1529069 RepID=UPI001657571F|nr:energy transducer TonB [Polaribacter sp. BM10]